MKTFALALLLALTAAPAQDMPEPARPGAQHVWLRQLVGEWSVVSEGSMGEDQPPFRLEFTEKVRALGELWVVAESTATFGDTPFTSMMTLGFDPARGTFVGTWIDTMQTHLWSYVGELDEARRVLTLEAGGPSWEDPKRMALYRDVLELVDADKKVLRSSVKNEDGTWTEFMKAEYRRVK